MHTSPYRFRYQEIDCIRGKVHAVQSIGTKALQKVIYNPQDTHVGEGRWNLIITEISPYHVSKIMHAECSGSFLFYFLFLSVLRACI